MAELKPYPAYKDSDLPWLRQVPERWEVQRAKRILRCIDVRSLGGDEELLTVSSARGVIPRSTAAVTMFKAESYRGYKLCWPGDLVINSLWAWAGGLGVSRYHGIVSSAYSVYRPRVVYEAYSSFIHELVRSIPFQWELQVRSKGIWISRLQLTDESFLNAPIPIPPPTDQAAIVRYLDHADRKVRHAIRARQQLIKLLTEQKQAIINRAVTRGLDPNVRLKPSGVPWLGDVPEHWQILRLKNACQHIVGGSTPRSDKVEYWNGDIVWVTPIDVTRSQRLDTSLRRITREGLNSCSATLVPAGSIIVTCRAPVGKVAVAATELCTNQGCKAIVLRSEVLTTAFGALLMQTLEPELQSLANGTTFSEIPLHKLACVPIPVPTIGEQDAIVRDVDDATANADKAIDAARREIDLLREYHTRLIADVVTGKLDVRGVKVPDDETDIVPEELESVDDVEATDESDDAAEGNSDSNAEERA
jgi:type I restriction enzyme S subunit